jgi:uncharacterized Fe-S cluster-containing protein
VDLTEKTPQTNLSRIEQVSEDLISGKIPCDDCPDLKRMVEQARQTDLGKERLEQIIDYHLQINNEKERLNQIV